MQDAENKPNGLLYHYVIIRKDIPIGAAFAQCVHAAGESNTLGSLPSDTHAVALHARDQPELLRIHEKLTAAGIPHKLVREPDAPWNGAAMAIGVTPMPRDAVRKLLSNLPLVS